MLGSKVSFESKISHADDTVQGCADFVAHVRQKIAFGAIGSFCLFLGFQHCVSGSFSFGDVAIHADHALERPGGGGQNRTVSLDKANLPRRPNDAELAAEISPGSDGSLNVGDGAREVLSVNAFRPVLIGPVKLFGFDAVQLAHSAIPNQGVCRKVIFPYAEVSRVRRQSKSGGTFPQAVVGQLSFGHIADSAEKGGLAAEGQCREADFGRKNLAVRAAMHPLKSLRAMLHGGGNRLIGAPSGRSTVWLDGRGEIGRVQPEELIFGGITKHVERG